MRILFLAPQPFFEARGTPINVRNVVTALSGLGHSVDLLVYPHGEDVEIPNVSIHRVARVPGVKKAPIGPSKEKLVYDAVMFFHAFWLLFTRRYDAVHAVEDSAFIAWPLCWLFRTPFVFDMDSVMSDQLRYSGFIGDGMLLRLFTWMETSALTSAKVVITVCQSLTEAAVKRVPAGKVHQVEDIPMEPPAPPQGYTADRLKKELGIGEGRLTVVYTGNLEPYQGGDLMIESAGEVVKREPLAVFVIVGGSEADVEKYRRKAETLGISANVIFTGHKGPEWMQLFYEMADILLSPRVKGTNTPLKIYTYLKTGKAVVATDLPTHTQVLNSDIAVLAKPEKLAYSEGILLLLKDKELRERLGGRGKDFVEKNFNRQMFDKKIASAYENLR
ncbi:MAG: glycosyltransferase [Nitrospinae bacterium]|nr:glycosyltransferase [Nitrospinota bacterium]